MSRLFLPFIFRFSNNSNTEYDHNVPTQNSENQEPSPQRERIILVNPFTQAIVVMEGASDSNALVRRWASKDGQSPSSKASMEALPSVEISEGEDGECVVCLEEWKPIQIAKEMPCSHKFHGECIDKWLGIHGSCPVCRFKMPVADDEEIGKKREIWLGFSSDNGRGNEDSVQIPSPASNDVAR